MKIARIMTPPPIHACHLGAPLNLASQLLWDLDCGLLPILDAEGRVVGTLTDRDVCMAAYTTDARLSQLSVESAMSRRVVTCKATDGVQHALQLMEAEQIRRLPVVDDEGRLVGLISITDLARRSMRGRGVAPDHVCQALSAITQPRRAPPRATSEAEQIPARSA